ncbi:MAG: quinolinate synthase NadA [bacterium]
MEEIINKIKKLKKEKNAVILAHNYQLPEIQDIADYVGDSLGLSIEASKTSAKTIVFCGVRFMAETAAIMCPDKSVMMPDVSAGCPMADMIKAEDVRDLKAKHPGHIVVAYVNTSAEVKAESDYCCTSANAVKVVEKLSARGGSAFGGKDKNIIFIPDKYLGDYASRQTGKQMVLFNGFCPIHIKILPEHIKAARQQHPKALVVVHPECLPEVIGMADKAVSTGGMLEFAKGSPAQEFIIGTEIGIIYRLQKENPSKKFYAASSLAVCPNMKRITIEKVLWALEQEETRITVKEGIASKAKFAIDRMLELV